MKKQTVQGVDVSVVVPFHNADSSLPDLLNSLLHQDYFKGRFEIIFVDDGSSTSSVSDFIEAKSRESLIDLCVIRCKTIGGPARARNLGIRRSKGRIIAFTDADVVPRENWLSELVLGFKDGSVGGVAGRVVTDFEKLISPLIIAPISEFVTCNIAYTREALLRCGMFDETFRVPYREDSDLAFRVLDLGYRVVIRDSAVVYHPVRRNTLGVFSKMLRYHMYDVLLLRKHPVRARRVLGVHARWFSLEGLMAIAVLAGVIGLYTVAPLVYFLVYVISLYFSVTVVLAIAKPSARGKSLVERIHAAVWHEIDTIITIFGHLAGSLKFKKFFV
jgi:glycosyltransferase involved in cell wall biosynthesis